MEPAGPGEDVEAGPGRIPVAARRADATVADAVETAVLIVVASVSFESNIDSKFQNIIYSMADFGDAVHFRWYQWKEGGGGEVGGEI